MVLITRPNHDLATNYLCSFSEEIISTCTKRSVKYIDLKGLKAQKVLFDSYIKKNRPKFMIINGHGSELAIGGFDNEILIDKYVVEYEKSIIYARSCKSAAKLGSVLVKSGLGAFIGYTKNYVVLLSRKRNTNPLLDNVARLFLEPSNLIAISIIKGNTVKDADAKSKKALIKNLKEVLSSKMKDRDEVAAYLLHDINSQVVIGDSEAKM